MKIKSWEVVLVIVILFLVCSTSLYWYDYFTKTKKQSVERALRLKWEEDVMANINALRQSQQQVLDVLNFNIMAGKLVMPQKEKK